MDAKVPSSGERNEPFAGSVRRAGINPNRWYVIAKATEIRDQHVGRVIWREPVVLFRNRQGELRAMEDRCAHRFVKLSHGRVIDDRIECAYHGWQFDGAGRCVHVAAPGNQDELAQLPGQELSERQKARFRLDFSRRSGAVRAVSPMEMSEWDDTSRKFRAG